MGLDTGPGLRTVYEDLPDCSKRPGPGPGANLHLRAFLDACGSDLELQEGEILFRQDERGDGIYWIESGLLVVLQGRLDEPRLLTFRHPGQVVGEIAMLDQVQRTATIAAMKS